MIFSQGAGISLQLFQAEELRPYRRFFIVVLVQQIITQEGYAQLGDKFLYWRGYIDFQFGFSDLLSECPKFRQLINFNLPLSILLASDDSVHSKKTRETDAEI